MKTAVERPRDAHRRFLLPGKNRQGSPRKNVPISPIRTFLPVFAHEVLLA
jgi:hypothetical protein